MSPKSDRWREISQNNKRKYVLNEDCDDEDVWFSSYVIPLRQLQDDRAIDLEEITWDNKVVAFEIHAVNLEYDFEDNH
jgi:hypothetical protein